MKSLRAIDLCCGAGGWAVAAKDLPIEIVTAIDSAHDCCRTYEYNHPSTETIEARIQDIQFDDFQNIDIVLGSIPCEQISVARNGIRLGKDELAEWHGLLDAVLAAVATVGSEYWCVENVIQMRRHLPPLTPYVVINAGAFSAQARKRLFVGRFPMPKAAENNSVLRDHLRPGPHIISEDILLSDKVSKRQWYQKRTKRLLDVTRKSPTITDFGSRHSRGFVVRHGNRERILQFTEAASIQGFPDDYVFVAPITRAWKMVAQAVPIPVSRAILEAIVEKALPIRGDLGVKTKE